MKSLVFVLIINCLVFFSCKEANTSCENLVKDDVCVVLKNRSGRNIKLLELKYGRGKKEIRNLADNENANISFNSPGESSYSLNVIFEDGCTLKSGGTYIEGGYKITEVIHRDRIETKFADLY